MTVRLLNLLLERVCLFDPRAFNNVLKGAVHAHKLDIGVGVAESPAKEYFQGFGKPWT